MPFSLHPWFWPLDLLQLVLVVLVIGVEIVALIDSMIRPSKAYEAASKQSKAFWMIILGVATAATLVLGGAGPFGIFGIIGLIAALVYMVDVRPAIRGLSRGGY
ncbi:MAG: DUF2516 family protein [Streptosporangiales bacterium]|nr:DUF2516 family protein [Streptosporangiales bacterium]